MPRLSVSRGRAHHTRGCPNSLCAFLATDRLDSRGADGRAPLWGTRSRRATGGVWLEWRRPSLFLNILWHAPLAAHFVRSFSLLPLPASPPHRRCPLMRSPSAPTASSGGSGGYRSRAAPAYVGVSTRSPGTSYRGWTSSSGVAVRCEDSGPPTAKGSSSRKAQQPLASSFATRCCTLSCVSTGTPRTISKDDALVWSIEHPTRGSLAEARYWISISPAGTANGPEPALTPSEALEMTIASTR